MQQEKDREAQLKLQEDKIMHQEKDREAQIMQQEKDLAELRMEQDLEKITDNSSRIRERTHSVRENEVRIKNICK